MGGPEHSAELSPAPMAPLASTSSEPAIMQPSSTDSLLGSAVDPDWWRASELHAQELAGTRSELHGSHAWPLRILRSSIMDAERLDMELLSLLQEQSKHIFELMPERTAGLEPELDTLLGLLVFSLSVWRNSATPGGALLNLRYRNEHAQRPPHAASPVHGNSVSQIKTGGAGSGGSSSGESRGISGSPGSQKGGVSGGSSLGTSGGPSGVMGPDMSPWQRLAMGAGHLVLPYLWGQLGQLVYLRGSQEGMLAAAWEREREAGRPLDASQSQASSSWACWFNQVFTQARLRGALRGVENVVSVASLLNLLVFLRDGKYRSLLERFLGVRQVYTQHNMTRIISFEYLNRQLVWQELSEFLLFMLPLINVNRMRRFTASLLAMLPNPALILDQLALAGAPAPTQQSATCPNDMGPGTPSVASGSSPGEQQQQQQQNQLLRMGSSSCPLCGSVDILIPYIAYPCQHVYCYYCLRSSCEADVAFSCVLDGVRVSAMRRAHASRG